MLQNHYILRIFVPFLFKIIIFRDDDEDDEEETEEEVDMEAKGDDAKKGRGSMDSGAIILY